jgi:hypothetical protein
LEEILFYIGIGAAFWALFRGVEYAITHDTKRVFESISTDIEETEASIEKKIKVMEKLAQPPKELTEDEMYQRNRDLNKVRMGLFEDRRRYVNDAFKRELKSLGIRDCEVEAMVISEALYYIDKSSDESWVKRKFDFLKEYSWTSSYIRDPWFDRGGAFILGIWMNSNISHNSTFEPNRVDIKYHFTDAYGFTKMDSKTLFLDLDEIDLLTDYSFVYGSPDFATASQYSIKSTKKFKTEAPLRENSGKAIKIAQELIDQL